MLTYSMIRFLSLLLLGLCARVVFVVMCGCRSTQCCGCSDCDACTVVCVSCMFAASLLGCEGDGNAVVESGRGVVAVSAYMGGTRGSCVLASACDVLEISVVRGVCGVCDMCMCLARGGVGGVGDEWVTGLGLGFTKSGGTWGKWDVLWEGGVMSVCVVSLD